MALSLAAPAKSKKELALQLGVSRQSLYYKPKLPEKDLQLKSEIEKVMMAHKRYGHKRIAWELKINKKRVLRVMKLFNLKPKRSRKPPFKPEDTNQAPMAIPNLLSETIIDAQNIAYGLAGTPKTRHSVRSRSILNKNKSYAKRISVAYS